jgi:hypothetical protein
VSHDYVQGQSSVPNPSNQPGYGARQRALPANDFPGRHGQTRRARWHHHRRSIPPPETIRVTIRDERLARKGRDPILEVTERTEPVQRGDILALSHDGTEVEVLGIRQIFAAGRWEQVAYVGDVWRYRPSPLLAWIRRIRPHFWGVC